MRNRLLQLSKGIIEYQKPAVSFSTDRLTGILPQDKHLTMDVGVNSLNHVPMHLFFYTEDVRVQASQPLFTGRSAKMTVDVNTVGLSRNDRLTGEICVVYNGGEMKLPYDFTVGVADSSNSGRVFENVDEFAAFAQENPEEAARIFSWKNYMQLPFMHDIRCEGLYDMYYSTVRKDAGLKEFLKACGASYDQEPETSAEKLYDDTKYLRSLSSMTSVSVKKNIRIMRLYLQYEAARHQGSADRYEFGCRFDDLKAAYPNDLLVRLLKAYFLTSEGDFRKAKEELIPLQNPIQKERLEKRDLYCLFLQLASTVQHDAEKTATSGKLIHKYFTDGTNSFLLYLLEYRLNPDVNSSAENRAQFLSQCYVKGIRNDAVLQETCFLWQEETVKCAVLTEYELRALLYGLRKDLISEEKLFEVLSNELKNPRLLPVYLQILKLGYKKYHSPELLQAVVNVFVQQKKKSPDSFYWYSEAIRNKAVCSGLYEYYLLSAPENLNEALLREAVCYFAGDAPAGEVRPEFLYWNVLSFYLDDAEIQALYHDRIASFGLKKAVREEYSAHMIPIFKEILKEEYLTDTNASALTELYYLKRITTELNGMKYVVIHYPQLRRETVYRMYGNEVIAPVFSEEALIAFENDHGERFADPSCKTEKVCEDNGMKATCQSRTKSSLLTELAEADEIIAKGAVGENDLFTITGLIRHREVAPFYRMVLYEKLIDLSAEEAMKHVDCCDFLLEADFESFTPEYRVKYLQTLIRGKHYKEACEKVLSYGFDGLDDDSLLDMCENIMDQQVIRSSRMLLCACIRLYRHQKATQPVYGLLAEYYQGSVQDMFDLIRTLRRKKLPTKEMIERTITVCLYTDKRKNLDSLFDWYVSENRRDETLMAACLVLRSHEYFLGEHKLNDSFLTELKKNADRLPDVALFALLTYAAEHVDELSEDERIQTEKLLEKAVDKNCLLGCFRFFDGKIRIPFELEARSILEYRNREAERVSAVGQILPDGRLFHRSMKKVYPGVFTCSFILYKREWIQYYYNVCTSDGESHDEDGEIAACIEGGITHGSRYEDFTRLAEKSSLKDVKDTTQFMYQLAIKDGMISKIYGDRLEQGSLWKKD